MRDIARTVEAAAALLLAAALVRLVRFDRWRALLTLTAPVRPCGSQPVVRVTVAIGRAERRVLGHAFRCLPRAMAAHWMLRRRGVASVVRLGTIAGAGGGLDFHAWLDTDDGTVIGQSDRRFAPVLSPGRG